MRFVRVHTRVDTGEVIGVTEQETPFERDETGVSFIPGVEIENHDLGAMEDDFDPTMPDGTPCSQAMHLFKRIERVAGAKVPLFRAKQGEHLPKFINCPGTMAGIQAQIAQRGPHSLPRKVRAWLTLAHPEKAAALGMDTDITPDELIDADRERCRRDPWRAPQEDRIRETAQRRMARALSDAQQRDHESRESDRAAQARAARHERAARLAGNAGALVGPGAAVAGEADRQG